jgi:two-component system response regulator DesR
MSVSVVIAGPTARCRGALYDALQGRTELEVVGEAATRSHAGDVLRMLAPDVAVVDLALLSTCDFFLHGWGPVSRCTRIVVVGPEDPGLAHRLLAMGACAYVPWDRAQGELAVVVGETASAATW